MVSVQLNDEEKFHVLLVALSLLLIALLVSICLASSLCPLNRWLLERDLKRRRHRQQLASRHLQRCILQGRQQQQLAAGLNRAAALSHYGRAHCSLGQAKGNSLAPSYLGPPPAYEAALRASRLQSLGGLSAGSSPDWVQAALAQSSGEQHTERQLDFGDYFHQAREQLTGDHVAIQMGDDAGGPRLDARCGPQPPVMMRLWVRLLEPGELVARARAQCERNRSTGSGSASRRMSLSRQLSIPQLFGSLMTLAGAKCSPPVASQTNQNSDALSSLSSSSSFGEQRPEKQQQHQQQQQGHQQGQQHVDGSAPSKVGRSTTGATCDGDPEQVAERHSLSWPRPGAGRVLSPTSSITSRVLHMNVASFSYVKDETLISTRRHNQLNFHHFYAAGGASASARRQTGGGDKMCQLLISICDVENLLSSAAVWERACAHLGHTSSVRVQCEILTSKGRLLRNPLRALKAKTSSPTHTVNFAATLPAVALEQPALCQPPAAGPGPAGCQEDFPPSSIKQIDAAGGGSTDESIGLEGPQSGASCPNWRHEQSADGRPIVVFDSVPKQLNHQSSAESVDLIQFDSVFVSPILSKSTLEDGFIRLRVVGQCKYVNETCLAELKLPLKQLLRVQSRDNLGDCSLRAASEQQAELVLDNLLTNLVTASTGSPLSSLIEQIEQEEQQVAGGEQLRDSAAEELNSGTQEAGHFRLPWPLLGADKSEPAGRELQRSASSLGAALDKLEAWQADLVPVGPEVVDWREECERRLEQNYCRSLLVSHWLNHLLAPSYECRRSREPRGRLLLGLTFLPTANRIIFNAHRASVELDSLAASKQLAKKLRLQSDTSYLLRFLMLANGRVLKRKQVAPARRPEWDSQEAITFDLVSVSVERPTFVVALLMRNAQASAMATGSLQSLPNYCSYAPAQTGGPTQRGLSASSRSGEAQSEPESVRRFVGVDGPPGATCRMDQSGGPQAAPLVGSPLRQANGRDLVVGHLVIGGQIWSELRGQPRRQIVRQFELL